MKKILNKEQPMSTFVTTKTEGILNKPFIHVLTILFITFLIYSNTFDSPFQFDDYSSIVENSGISDLHNYLLPKANRDLGFLTFSMNYSLGGLDVIGYHAVNLIIHMLNAVLVYALVSLTFRTPFFRSLIYNKSSMPWQNMSYLSAFVAGGIFAVHPLQTESVTYITQRFTSLATFFYLLSLVMYIKWREDKEQQSKRYASCAIYAVSLLSAILAMKTKEIAFTLPVCIAVYEFMFFKERPIKRVLYLIPLLLTMLIIPMTLLSLNAPVEDIIVDISEITRDHPDIPRLSYLFTQFRVIVTYIRLLILPINQNLDYDYPVYHSLFDPAVLFSFIFLLLVFGLGVYLYRISRITHYALRITAFGIFWFFVTLSVESSVIPLKDIIFEHRVYLPSVGIFMALTGAIGAGIEKWGIRAVYAKKALLYFMLTVMLSLSVATYARNALWQDSIRLWGNVVEGSPNKMRPHLKLGIAFTDQGRIDEAIREYQTAIKLKPDFADAYFNLGAAYFAKNRINEAIKEYQSAIKLNSDYVKPHNNLGNAYMAQGRIDEAIREYQTALKLRPDYVDAHYNLGLAYAAQGRIDEAINEFKISVQFKPDYADAHNNLGNAYTVQGRSEEAMIEYQTALKIDPGHAKAHYNLGNIYSEQGRIAEAINEYQITLKLNPGHANAHYNLGVAYAAQGRSEEAIKEFKSALKLKPDIARANQSLDFFMKK